MLTKAMFFSVENDECGMGECLKGGKEWVSVGWSWKELNENWMKECAKWGEGVCESGKKWYFCLSVGKSGNGGKE